MSQPSSGPAGSAAAITPDDDNDLPVVTRGLIVGVPGSLHCIMQGNGEQTFPLPAGQFALCIVKVFENSTCSNLVALW